MTLHVTGCREQATQGVRVYFRTWLAETLANEAVNGRPGLSLIKVKIPHGTDAPKGATPVAIVCDGAHSNTATVWVQ